MTIKDTPQYKQLKEAMDSIRNLKVPEHLQQKALEHLLLGFSSDAHEEHPPARAIESTTGSTIASTKDLREYIKKINPKIKLVNADLKEIKKEWPSFFDNTYCVIQLQTQISSPYKKDYVQNNITSVENVLKVCQKYKVKHLIHISTSAVISMARDEYSITKTLGENAVRKSKVPHTILRPPMLYGCFEMKHLGYLGRILDATPLLPLPGNGKYIRQPLYVKDFCKIIIKLIAYKPQGKIYNIIGKEKIYFVDMLKKLTKIKKQKRILLRIPIPIFLLLLKLYTLTTGKKPYQKSQLKALMTADIFPVVDWEKEFGVKYTSFEEGLKDMINSEYYKYMEKMPR